MMLSSTKRGLAALCGLAFRHAPRTVQRGRRWSKPALFLTALATLAVLAQSVSLVVRASDSDTASDFGVFYQTATMLNNGAGGEIYDIGSQRSGWRRCIPPAGLVIFQPLARLSPTLAGVFWMLLNLGLLAAAVIVLHRFIGKLDRQRHVYQSAFPWMVGIFLLLSCGSIQVGQFSLLFVACWIFSLSAAASGRSFWAGMALAFPAAIKLYPALMLAVPLSTGKRREVLFFWVGLFIVGGIIPFLVYGPRTWDLTTSFLHNVILNPQGRIADAQKLASGNQGLDAVLLRYLSYNPKFHSRHPVLPHLSIAPEQVLLLANILRLAVLALSAAVIARWQRGVRDSPLYAALQMAAFWSATLYLLLPETKSRYAVYTFLAFVPLIGAAVEARMQGNHRRHAAFCALTAFCLVLTLLLIPGSLRAYGVGFIGSLALWIANLRNIALKSQTEPALDVDSRSIAYET